jgi:hypothetical protein
MLPAQFISGNEPLRYMILFENLESATAPAQEVVITDQLDATKVDLTTLSLGSMSFGDFAIDPPPGLREFTTTIDLRPQMDLLVHVDAGVDLTTGRLTWRFTSLDPATGALPEDPFAGFLAPNTTRPQDKAASCSR